MTSLAASSLSQTEMGLIVHKPILLFSHNSMWNAISAKHLSAHIVDVILINTAPTSCHPLCTPAKQPLIGDGLFLQDGFPSLGLIWKIT